MFDGIPMDLVERGFNLAEVALWGAIAIVLFAFALRASGKKKRLLFIATLAFAAFSWSDYIEAGTGAWWDPPWLLLLKASCIVTMLLVWRKWYLLSRLKPADAGPT